MKQFLAGESEGFPEGLFSQALGNANVATLMEKKFFRSILLFEHGEFTSLSNV